MSSSISVATRHDVETTAAEAGMRLDRVLAARLPDLSRARLQTLIRDGRVSASGRVIADPAKRVKPGQSLTVLVPPAVEAVPAAQTIPLTVVHEDADVIVVDKPAGLVVHPGPGNPDRTLVNALLAHCGDQLSGIGGVRRPGIVHRLDKDTSGLMVVAKTDRAHQALAAQFADRSLARAYAAVVWGVPVPRSGEIDGPIGRSPRNRKKMAVVARGGKPALTRYHVDHVLAAASLLTCRLATGRTHQIRVHCAHIGHPVVGDPVYGGGRRGNQAKTLSPAVSAALGALGRQALHARSLVFTHPSTHVMMRFDSEIPNDINALLDAFQGG